MSDYISKSELREWVENWFVMNRHYHPYAKKNTIPIGELYDILERMPTIAVPVVKCKDCKYYRAGEMFSQQKFCFRLKDRDGAAIGYNFAEDDFCSYGEMREE